MCSSGIAGLYSSSTFSFLKEPPYCSPQWLYQYTFPPIIQEGSLFSTPSPAFIVCRYFEDGHSVQCKVTPHCSFFFFLNIIFFFFFLFFFFFFFLFYLFIYLWLCWVFVSVRGLSPVVASGGHSSSRCTGLSLSRPLLLWSTGSRRAGSVIVAHGPSCSAACGIFPDQGSNPCPLHWQADSQPLHHQGSPSLQF